MAASPSRYLSNKIEIKTNLSNNQSSIRAHLTNSLHLSTTTMSAYATVDFCIEAGMLPRSMLIEMRNRSMDTLQHLNVHPSVSDSSKDICRQKIKFYMHLSEGDLVRARVALEALRLLYNDVLDTLMFGDKGASLCAVIGGATPTIQYQSDKTDQNAKTMGDRFMGELKRWEQMLTCRVV